MTPTNAAMTTGGQQKSDGTVVVVPAVAGAVVTDGLCVRLFGSFRRISNAMTGWNQPQTRRRMTLAVAVCRPDRKDPNASNPQIDSS